MHIKDFNPIKPIKGRESVAHPHYIPPLITKAHTFMESIISGSFFRAEASAVVVQVSADAVASLNSN